MEVQGAAPEADSAGLVEAEGRQADPAENWSAVGVVAQYCGQVVAGLMSWPPEEASHDDVPTWADGLGWRFVVSRQAVRDNLLDRAREVRFETCLVA